jgi:hypothetical protein
MVEVNTWAGANPIFVAGWPRSGNTWLLRLLSDFLSAPIRNMPPDMNVDDRWCKKCNGDWVLVKTHWAREQWQDGVPVVVIRRDPRDVAISAMYARSIEPTDANLMKVIDTIINDAGRGNWEGYNRAWDKTGVPITSYESLHHNGAGTLAWLSFELMHHMPTSVEVAGVLDRVSFAKCKAADPHFTRKGIVGDWKNHFKLQHGQLIHDAFGAYMKELGYIDSEDWWEKLPS